jgi:hypothetical protein
MRRNGRNIIGRNVMGRNIEGFQSTRKIFLPIIFLPSL